MLPLEKINTMPDDLRDNLSLRIYEKWDDIVEALFQLAKGIYREEIKVTDKGEIKTRIYQEKPDKEIAQYLANQVIGKPKENVTLQGRVNFIMDE